MSESKFYGWVRCSHAGIGELGCVVCDPVISHQIARAVWVEREACAKVAEALEHASADITFAAAQTAIAAAIRARDGR